MPNHILINNKIDSYKEIIEVTSDKSISIRCVLLASIAVGISKISNLLTKKQTLSSKEVYLSNGINKESK